MAGYPRTCAPRTRVLTSTWDLGTWQPDLSDDGPVFLWIVPERVAGNWDWDVSVAGKRPRYASIIEQHFQKVEGAVRVGDRREVLEAATLRGSDITFTLNITLDGLGLTRHEFSGKVEGDKIVGTVNSHRGTRRR